MWRTLIRLAPLALAGFRWWQRRQQRKGRTSGASPHRTPQSPPAAPGDRLP